MAPVLLSEIRKQFAERYKLGIVTLDNTVELIGASFYADHDTIFGMPNPDYITRELDWYLSRSLKIQDMGKPIPRIWEDIASVNGEVNSNYGYLMFAPENGSQYMNVVRELTRNPTSRRGTAIYTRPSMHVDQFRDGMNDFVCTNAVNYFIRQGALHTVVQMRSNDVVFGYRNDYAWQRFMQANMARELKVPVGELIWQVGSLHVYERHFKLLDEYLKTGRHE